MLPPINFPTLGWQIIEWIEEYLVHGPGDVQGKPIEIDDELALHICWLYRVWPKGHAQEGRRLTQRGVLSRPKGRAKSEIAGALVCAEALGPVRCDGFDARGEPVGVPVVYPFIRCLATEEEQSGNTYDNVTFMLAEGKAASEYRFDIGRSAATSTRVLIREAEGGEIVPSSSGNASKDGGKETFAVADETHLYVTRGLRAMYATVSRNTGKRKAAEPLMYDTTTAWLPGERSIAEQAADRYAGIDIETAVARHGVLYDHRQGDEPKRFNDDRSLAKALRAGYGPAAEWMDFRRIVRIIRDAEDPEADAYRYWLNRPRRGASHWLAPDDIQGVRDEFEVERGTAITLGFDGSDDDDHTTLWLATEDGRVVPVGIWAPQPGEQDWRVPRVDVTAAVDWCFDHFRVVRMYNDPPWFQEEIASWQGRHGSPPVIDFWTNSDTRMGAACGSARTAIRRKAIRLSVLPLLTDNAPREGKPIAVWHLENARTRKVRVKFDDHAEEAYVLRKDRPGSPLKIDSATAIVLALEARTDALAKGEFEVTVHEYASWR